MVCGEILITNITFGDSKKVVIKVPVSYLKGTVTLNSFQDDK